MSNRKRLTVVTPTSENSAPVSARVLSPEDLENAHKTPAKVKEIYIKALGGIVYSRPISSDVVVDFLRLAADKDEISQIELVNILSKFASEALCNKDGSDFISMERAKKFSVETLDEICAGISTGGGTRKKASRR